MKCKEIKIKIHTLIDEYNRYNYQLQQIIHRDKESGNESWILDEQNLRQYNEEKIEKINTLLNQLYVESKKAMYNFFDAPFSVYKYLLDLRLNIYLFNYEDASEIDFFEEELIYYSNPSENRKITKDNDTVYYHKFLNNQKKFNHSLKRKIEIIEYEINKLGHTVRNDKIIKKSNHKSDISNVKLDDFIKLMSNSNEIEYSSLISLHYNKMFNVKEELKLEIGQNLLKLESNKKEIYIDVLQNNLQNLPNSNLDTNQLNKWLKKYNVELSNFPEFNRGKLYDDLMEFDSIYGDKICKSPNILEVQKDFYNYSAFIYINEIKDFVSKYSLKKNKNQYKNYNKKIFKSYESQKWFDTSLRSLNTIDEVGKIRRGFQAIANTFYKDEICRKIIFQYAFQLKDYITHLNKEYNARIRSDNKLSESVNHIDKVNHLAKEYQSKQQNNTIE